MQNFVSGLQGQVTSSTIFTELAPIAPWVGGMILVSIVLVTLRRSVGGAGRGKAKF